MEEECSHSAAAEKDALCHPILKLAAICHYLTCWGVPMSLHATARRQLRLAEGGWLPPGHQSPLPAVDSTPARADAQPKKRVRDLLWLCGHCSKNSEGRNGMLRETLQASTGNWLHFSWILPQISSNSRAGILKGTMLIITSTPDVGISIQLLMPSTWQ